MGSPIRVIWYTDPHNIWCWGFEPTIRRLEVRYPDTVRIETRQGGLFEDFSPVREQWARMSGGRWKDSVRTFFEAVSSQHRMPMNADAIEEILRDVDPHLEAAPIKANEETALNLIQRYGMMATTELAAVLGTTDDDAEILLEELEGRDDVIRRPVGRGLMWELPTHRIGTSKADVTSRSS